MHIGISSLFVVLALSLTACGKHSSSRAEVGGIGVASIGCVNFSGNYVATDERTRQPTEQINLTQFGCGQLAFTHHELPGDGSYDILDTDHVVWAIGSGWQSPPNCSFLARSYYQGDTLIIEQAYWEGRPSPTREPRVYLRRSLTLNDLEDLDVKFDSFDTSGALVDTWDTSYKRRGE